MKKIICMIMVFTFAFCFSACGGNSEKETETSLPAPELSVEQLANAVSSGNGAVIDKLEGERYSFFAYVDEIQSSRFINCYMHNLNNSAYDYDYGIKITDISLDLSDEYDEQQEKMILNLKQGDKVFFEGMLTEIYSYDNKVSLKFGNVLLTEQNETAQ